MTIALDMSIARILRMAGAPLALVVTGSLIALNINVAKAALLAQASPVSFLFWALLGATVIVWIVAALARQAPPRDGLHLRYGLFSGLLSIAAPNTLLFLAIPHVGAGFVALCAAFPPLYTYILALLVRLEAPHWLRAGGVLAGIAGALLLGLSKASLPDSDGLWIAIALFVPVIVGTGNIYRTLYWPKGATSLQLAPLMLAGAAVWTGLYVLGFEASTAFASLQISLANLLLPAQIAIVALMYIMYFVLQKIAGPVYFSQIGSVAAALGAVIAASWFHEGFPPAIVPAALLIGLGVVLVTLAPRWMKN